MSDRPLDLVIAPSPFVAQRLATDRVMIEVTLSLVPVLAAAAYFFGVAAFLIVAGSSAGAVLTEWFFSGRRAESIKDWSALLTGVILGLTLPPGLPVWMAFLGGAAAIGLGKLVWGGLGQNIFNPSLVGRAFLQAAFPTALTTWVPPIASGRFSTPPDDVLALPFTTAHVDSVSSASPLGLSKFEHQSTDLVSLFWGNTAGSLGETCAALLLLCGIWLAARSIFNWRLCAGTLIGCAALSAVFHWINPTAYPGAVFMLLSGGLMFGAVFMVTDPVTSPATPLGMWVFGLGAGILTVVIRLFGGLPEGVMYSILLMNALSPHITRLTQPRVFGAR